MSEKGDGWATGVKTGTGLCEFRPLSPSPFPLPSREGGGRKPSPLVGRRVRGFHLCGKKPILAPMGGWAGLKCRIWRPRGLPSFLRKQNSDYRSGPRPSPGRQNQRIMLDTLFWRPSDAAVAEKSLSRLGIATQGRQRFHSALRARQYREAAVLKFTDELIFSHTI
jgi:hypothetical protein